MTENAGLTEYIIHRVERGAIEIDGRLDDPAWERAAVAELRETVSGGQPGQATRARMLYDDEWLYAGFHCEDRDIWGTMTGHDDPIYNEEVVEIFIDPTGTLTAYFELEVSPLNTGFDALILNDSVLAGTEGRGDRFSAFPGWDPEGFRHAVHVKGELNAHDGRAEYWQCEMAIRFDELFLGACVPPKKGDIWRGNLYRIDIEGDTLEESALSPTGMPDFHMPSRFARFVFG